MVGKSAVGRIVQEVPMPCGAELGCLAWPCATVLFAGLRSGVAPGIGGLPDLCRIPVQGSAGQDIVNEQPGHAVGAVDADVEIRYIAQEAL